MGNKKRKSTKQNLAYRTWFYFRQGWSIYFAFIIAAVNTMITTYYLAVEKIPTLKSIFPSFEYYLATFVIIGIPLLVLVGYFHFKRTSGFASEMEITIESNPYMYKIRPGYDTVVLFPFFLLFTKAMIKHSQNENLSEEDIVLMKELQNKMKSLIDGGIVGKEKK